MLDNSKVAVVIPALNEAKTIENVVLSLISKNYIPIIVDDGSEDSTGEIANQLGAVVIRHDYNKGYEKALSSGIEFAIKKKFQFAVTFDADGQLDICDIQRFIDSMANNKSDLVVGVRSYRNRYCEYLFALYGKLRFDLQDPLCGMKLYRLDIVNFFLPFDSLLLIGVEMSFKMINSGCSFSEVPINVKKRVDVSRYGSSIKGELSILNALKRSIVQFGWSNNNFK